MTPTATNAFVVSSVSRRVLTILAPAPGRSSLFHLAVSFGLFGLFLVAIVDSSFVPLPIPGLTDIMLVLMAARHSANWLLLIVVSSVGSALGGYFSYQVGQRGGMAFLEKRVSKRSFGLVRNWMERHAILSVALPALLPPPMPLSPFVLAAGALSMSKRKFMTTFTISRTARHVIATWLGIYYGRTILRLWNHISARYSTTILVIVWTVIALSCAIAFWRLYKTSHTINGPHGLTPKSETAA
jgi:membrane protein YqaA with SNARE-associated domain